VLIESSPDNATWTHEGFATLTSGQWRLSGIELPPGHGYVRARAIIANTQFGSGSILQSVRRVWVSQSRLVNLSTRGLCLTGDDVLIPGFVITFDPRDGADARPVAL
jgi:hypothetical protein